MADQPREGRRARWPWTVTLAVTYAAVAALWGNAFPFVKLDMFAAEIAPHEGLAGPLIAERSDGSRHRVDRFVGWDCDAPVERLVRATCEPDVQVDFRFRRLDHRHLTLSKTGDQGKAEEVRLMRPLHVAYSGAGAAAKQCVVGSCRATYTGESSGFYGR